jgi:hypothetical protein
VQTRTINIADTYERIATLADAYALRVYRAVLEQHPGSSVSSPVGVWLLLAACVSAARDEHRAELEEVLGCSSEEARAVLATFMASAPPVAIAGRPSPWLPDGHLVGSESPYAGMPLFTAWVHQPEDAEDGPPPDSAPSVRL